MAILQPFPLSPLPSVKIKRRERKIVPMTLVNAFRCRDGGILLCADREENDGYNKREIDKIYRIQELHAFEVFIAGSGPSSVITKSCAEIHQSLLRAEYDGVDLWRDHQQVFESCLKSIHKDYAAHLKQYCMNLIVVIAERTKYSPLLYRTDLSMLVPEPLYAACGTGKPISDYLADRLFAHDRLGKGSLAVLATFIFREAERSASGVGLGADMVFIHEGDRSLHFIPPNKIKELAESIPSLEECINQCWYERITIPDWLKPSEPSPSQSAKS